MCCRGTEGEKYHHVFVLDTSRLFRDPIVPIYVGRCALPDPGRRNVYVVTIGRLSSYTTSCLDLEHRMGPGTVLLGTRGREVEKFGERARGSF